MSKPSVPAGIPLEAAVELEHLIRQYARTSLGPARAARGAKKRRTQYRPVDVEAEQAKLKEQIKVFLLRYPELLVRQVRS